MSRPDCSGRLFSVRSPECIDQADGIFDLCFVLMLNEDRFLAMLSDINFVEYEAHISDLVFARGFKIFFPVERNVTSFDHEILIVFYGGLDDFSPVFR